MEHERPFEHPLKQEAEVVDEIAAATERLGFVETEELSEIRDRLVEAMKTTEGEDLARELSIRYRELAEQIVEEKQGADYTEAQIGLLLAVALIKHDGGRIDDCLEDLEDAITYADGMAYDDIAGQLERIRDSIQK